MCGEGALAFAYPANVGDHNSQGVLSLRPAPPALAPAAVRYVCVEGWRARDAHKVLRNRYDCFSNKTWLVEKVADPGPERSDY